MVRVLLPMIRIYSDMKSYISAKGLDAFISLWCSGRWCKMVLKTNRLTRLRNRFLFINEEVKFLLLFNTKESSVQETSQFFLLSMKLKVRIISKWIWTCHQYWSLMIFCQDSSRTLENLRFVFRQLTCWLSVKRMNLRIHWDKWDPTHPGLHWKILSVMNRKIMNIILK